MDRINYLNIGLMVLSCLAAFAFPFELFLFAYAVLGPLHYLTEISWLHDRRYFVATRSGRTHRAERWWLALVVLTAAVMFYGLLSDKFVLRAIPASWAIALFYLVFVTAAILLAGKHKVAAAVLILMTMLALTLFGRTPYYGIVAVLLITVVHVFVFTAAFVLFGALKSKSWSGLLSLVVLVACAASFFVYVPPAFSATAGDYVRHSYGAFQVVNTVLIQLLGLGSGKTLSEIYDSTAGLMVMRLIAFAYTYHYLNWFSKTSVIKWHAIPKTRTAAIAGCWLASLALYAYSYALGFIVLYVLSVVHVMLEFPLNHRTFAGIGKELYALAVSARGGAAAARPNRRGRAAGAR